MRVVSEEEYVRLNKTDKPLEQARTHFFTDKDEEASHILQNSGIPEDIRLQLYSSLMNHVSKKLKQIINKPVSVKFSLDDVSELADANENSGETNLNSSNLSDETLGSGASDVNFNKKDTLFIDSLPKTKKPLAKMLMTKLKKHKDLIKWDETGRVTFFGDEFEPETSIADLVSFAVRDLKHDSYPNGLNRFLRVCKMLNVPSSFYRTSLRKDVAQDLMFSTNSAKRFANFENWESLSRNDTFNGTTDTFYSPAGEGSPPLTGYTHNYTRNVNERRKKHNRKKGGNSSKNGSSHN
jgi:hypothetical protein